MYSMSNELIKVPNCLITLLRMDEEGHMWFQCQAPIVQANEQNFPARLHFFRKGLNYFIDVSGSASIVDTADQDHDETTEDSKNRLVLLKLNVNNIEYTEPEGKMKTWFNEWIEKSYNWIISHLIIPPNQKSFLTKLPHTNEQLFTLHSAKNR